MHEPKISLIICAYNEEKYIGSCLEHVQKNAHDNFFEIIVVDNASTDTTKEIASRFHNVRVVEEIQKGLTRARQRGFLEAKGDVLAYIDADTQMPTGWYERVSYEFKENPKLAALSGPALYYDIPAWQRFLVLVYWYLFGMPVYFVVGFMIMGSNFAIRKDVLQKMNGFDTKIEFYGEDTNVARRASKFGKVKFTPKLKMYFSGRRLHNQGLLNTGYEYVKNFLSEAFLKKPVTTHYKDFR